MCHWKNPSSRCVCHVKISRCLTSGLWKTSTKAKGCKRGWIKVRDETAQVNYGRAGIQHCQGRGSFSKALKFSTIAFKSSSGRQGQALPWSAPSGWACPTCPIRAAQTCSLCRLSELHGGKKSTGIFLSPQNSQPTMLWPAGPALCPLREPVGAGPAPEAHCCS